MIESDVSTSSEPARWTSGIGPSNSAAAADGNRATVLVGCYPIACGCRG